MFVYKKRSFDIRRCPFYNESNPVGGAVSFCKFSYSLCSCIMGATLGVARLCGKNIFRSNSMHLKKQPINLPDIHHAVAVYDQFPGVQPMAVPGHPTRLLY